MVKWGWGWTLYSLLAFSTMINLTSKTKMVGVLKPSVDITKIIKRNFIRTVVRILMFGTIIWFIGTQLTFKIGDLTGTCRDSNESLIPDIVRRKDCTTVEGQWSSFDISGHTFLLIWGP